MSLRSGVFTYQDDNETTTAGDHQGEDAYINESNATLVAYHETHDLSDDELNFNDTLEKPTAPSAEEYPDGGLAAWLVVVGAMFNLFSTFGYVNSWGVFQEYYQETLLKDSTPSDIAWIGSIQYSLVFLPALIVGRLFDLGYFRSVLLSCSALLVASTSLVGQCTQYWQFVLCQGIAVGIGCGGIFGPTAAVVSHWFKRRRGIAMGYGSIGSSIGGTIFPIIARKLIPLVGFPWTMRIFGFILLFSTGLSNLLLKRRLPPSNVKGGLFNFSAFKSIPFSLYCISSFFVFLGLYTVLTYINVSSVSFGVSPEFAFYLVAIANVSSLFGRYASGILCDRFGPMSVMIPFTAVAGILTYAWPFARTEAPIIVITIFYGFSSGAYLALLANPMIAFGDVADVGRRIGMSMSILALGALVGPPISGVINAVTGGFEAVGYFAGSVVLVGVGLMCLSRYLVLGGFVGKL